MFMLSNTPGRWACALAIATFGAASAAHADTVVELTQTGCQFVESENGVDLGYSPMRADDCRAINSETGEKRLAEAKALTVKPGRYVFRVTNADVPYDLGFWLREHDYEPGNPIHKLSKTSVSGGGLTTGSTKDYVVELEPGEYVYSCPLNPTPDYRLVVSAE